MNSQLILNIHNIVRLELFLILLILAAGVWGFYSLALSHLSEERHNIFQRHLKGLGANVTFFVLFFGFHNAILAYQWFIATDEVSFYSGLLCILWGTSVLIKTLKIMAYEYFFFTSKKAGVPLLLVNVSSLLLSLFILGWISTAVFSVQITSLLTTSAVFTIVLGLALQDTLGNLFAAISLQIDKPFELDDWIELKNGSEKIAGQVKELTWRATVLLAITDEYITIPNKTLAQWQVVNFSGRLRPFYRGYFFRIPFTSSVEKAKSTLLQAIKDTPDILSNPPPLVMITDVTESWVMLKAVYALRTYGSQYTVADNFYSNALKRLEQEKIPLASSRLSIESSPSQERLS